MQSVISLRTRIVSCCLLLGVLPGCTREINLDEAVARANGTNVQRLSNLYFSYQSKNGWRGPGDQEQFKKFVRGFNPDKLTRIGINPNAIDELFISERDGEPFKIRYSVPGSAMGSSEPVIFESAGVDEKFMVGFLDMQSREVDKAEYDILWDRGASPEQTTTRAI